MIEGLRRHVPLERLLTVQEVRRRGDPDEELLAYAAANGLVVITHDHKTMIAAAHERIEQGDPFPGLIVSPDPGRGPVGWLIAELEILVEAGNPEDFRNQVTFLPLR